MTLDESLQAAARRLRERGIRTGMPNGLRSKIDGAIQTTYSPLSRRTQRTLPKSIGVFAVIGAVSFASLYRYEQLAHRSSQNPKESSVPLIFVDPGDPTIALRDKVRQAVDRANTCHIVRNFFYPIVNGNRVSWMQNPVPGSQREIWQRKEPYFYREERGGEVFIDDGKTAYHLIPPYTSLDAERDMRLHGQTQMVALSGNIIPTGASAQKHSGTTAKSSMVILRPQLLLIYPSTGDTPDTMTIGRYEPEHLLIGDDRISKAPKVLPYLELPPNGSTSVVPAHPELSKPSPAVIHKRSIDLNRKGSGEIGIIEEEEAVYRPTYSVHNGTRTSLIIDSSSYLPKRATVNSNFGSAVGDRTEFAATYGAAIPATLLKVSPEKGAIVIEASPRTDTSPSIMPERASLKGLAVCATVLECDAGSNIRYKLHWSLHGKPISFNHFVVLAQMRARNVIIVDSQKRPYISSQDINAGTRDEPEYMTAPLEPSVVGSAQPDQLTGQINLEIYANDSAYTITAQRKSYIVPLTFTVDLKAPRQASSTKPLPEFQQNDATLGLLMAEARSEYYLGEYDSRAYLHPVAPENANAGILPDAKMSAQEYADRGTYWSNIAINEAKRQGKSGLAKAYAWRFKQLTQARR